jgi:transcriptional regulator with XRE-family HTH domain
MPLPDRLKDARKRAGLTQKQLAERAGLHEMTVTQYEIGRRSPSLATVARLAAALHTTPSALVR